MYKKHNKEGPSIPLFYHSSSLTSRRHLKPYGNVYVRTLSISARAITLF